MLRASPNKRPRPAPPTSIRADLSPLLRLAGPLMLGSGLTLLALLVDRTVVALAGSGELAALGAAQAVVGVLTTVSLGIALGTLGCVARSLGSGDPRAASRALGSGIVLALGWGACAALVWSAAGLGEPLLQGLGGPSGSAHRYLQINLLGLPVHGALLVTAFALQGAGAGRAALWAQAVPAVGNLVLDPILVLGFGLGAPGAAWATLAANTLGLALAAHRLSRGRVFADGLAGLAPTLASLGRVARFGLPGSLEHAIRNAGALLVVLALIPFGAGAVSGYTAGLAIILLGIMPGLALGQAAASLVGQAWGAGDRPRARRIAWRASAFSAALFAAGSSLLVLSGYAPLRWILTDPVSLAAGQAFLSSFAPVLPLVGVGLVLGKSLHGAGRPRVSLSLAALTHGLVLASCLWLGRSYGTRAVFLAMSLTYAAYGVLAIATWARVTAPLADRSLTPQTSAPTRRTRVPRRRTMLRPALLRPALVALTLLSLSAITSCRATDFTQRRKLADPIMRFDDGPGPTHFEQKSVYSREGSAGGIGESAGGGCGCY